MYLTHKEYLGWRMELCGAQKSLTKNNQERQGEKKVTKIWEPAAHEEKDSL